MRDLAFYFSEAHPDMRYASLSLVKMAKTRALGMKNAGTHGFARDSGVFLREALVGVEPTVADLQSAALATWLQRQEILGNLGELAQRVKPSWQARTTRSRHDRNASASNGHG
jgi:hypothetical protein